MVSPDNAPAAGKMHAGEIDTDPSLVRRLVAAQFPQWAHHAVEPVRSSGTDNAIYRLGPDMSVRMPRIEWATGQVEKEREWLPQLAPHLPVAIPAVLAVGEPGGGYPWRWSVYGWLEGANPVPGRVTGLGALVPGLAQFVAALRRVDLPGGPSTGRGVPLGQRDAATRKAIDELQGLVDTAKASAAWDRALRAPAWPGPPVWIHGDLLSGNLLTVGGRLSAVIDFGCLGVGDPACDLIAAWNLFPAELRSVFRDDLEVDAATWERGRGWALSIALIQLPYYRETNPALAASARHTIAEVLAELDGAPSVG